MIDQTTLEGKVMTAALDLAASPGWSEVSLRDIADAAGVSLADVMEKFDDKAAILKVFVEHVDRAMLASAGDVEREQSARDAVFEVVMSRFDAMAPYKAGLKTIIGDRPALPRDPSVISMALATQNKVLQAAGISTTGAPALVRQLGLARIYGAAFQTWLNDDDPGMAKTMATLDKRLRQGEMTLRTLDDVAKSVDRVCDQVTGFASRIFSDLRTAAERRAAPDTTEPSATDIDLQAAQPKSQSIADTNDASPGPSPA